MPNESPGAKFTNYLVFKLTSQEKTEKFELNVPNEIARTKGDKRTYDSFQESCLHYLMSKSTNVFELTYKVINKLCFYYNVGYQNLHGDLITEKIEKIRILLLFLKGILSLK